MPVWCWGCSLDGINQTSPRSCFCPHPKPREDAAKGRAGSHFTPVWCVWLLHSLLSFPSLVEHQVWARSVCSEINAVVSPKPPGSRNWRVPEKRKR